MAEGGAQMDLPAHERTYDRFISVAKAGVIVCVIIAAVVIFLITR